VRDQEAVLMPVTNEVNAAVAAALAEEPDADLIESMNARLRKVTRNRGQFPSEQAALKVLYLAVRNLEELRRPNVGIRSSGWKQALQAFTIYFDGRIPTP
jgi:transposase-like protein